VNTTKLSIQVRPMILSDLDDIFTIDENIKARAFGESITFEDISTKQIFGMDESESIQGDKPSVTEAAELISFGFVAEVDGRVCGFILGRKSYIGSDATEFGEIVFLGVLPDYWRKGIAARLLDSLCNKFRGRDISTISIAVATRDIVLRAFFEHMGFSRGPLLSYTKTLWPELMD
jgi:ribosomal protein S18 acetylase RimI-like enzyme